MSQSRITLVTWLAAVAGGWALFYYVVHDRWVRGVSTAFGVTFAVVALAAIIGAREWDTRGLGAIAAFLVIAGLFGRGGLAYWGWVRPITAGEWALLYSLACVSVAYLAVAYADYFGGRRLWRRLVRGRRP